MATAGLGLPRTQRLLKPSDFERTMRGGQRLRDSLFMVCGRANTVGRPRLGITVSRRNCARAVARNRIKRRVRETFRQSQWELGGTDIVVVAYAPAATAPGAEFTKSLVMLLRKTAQKCKTS